MLLLFTGLACALLPPCVCAQVDLDRVTHCMRDNLPRTIEVDRVQLTVLDRSGNSRQLQGSLWAETKSGDSHVVWSLSAPADIAGSAMLAGEGQDGAESYLYLPALGRVRRIEDSDQEGRMFGTDLSYGDARRIASMFSDSALTVLGETRYQGRPAWQLAATVPPATADLYDRIDLTIDQQTCATLQADFLRNDVLRKQWTVPVEALRQSGRYWYAASGTMRDLQQNSQTQLRLSAVSTDAALPARRFDPKSFFH